MPTAATTDEAKNDNVASAVLSFVFDTTNPVVSVLNSAQPTDTNVSPIPITLTFNEPMYNFVIGDFSVTGGTLSNLVGGDGDATFTVDLTPSADGALTVNVAAGVANDEALNDNTLATELPFLYDTADPTVVLTSTQALETNENPVEFTATYNEKVINFNAASIAATSNTVGVTAVVQNFVDVDSAVGEVYTFEVYLDNDGSFGIEIEANSCTDPALNPNVASTAFTYIVDFFPVSAVLSSTMQQYTNTVPIPITVTLSEPPDTATIDAGGADFTTTHTGSSVTVSDLAVTGDALVYELNLNPVDEGTVTILLASGTISDVATNFNDADSNTMTFIFDTTNPTVAVSTATPSFTKTTPIEYVLTFSEPMLAVQASMLTFGDGSGVSYGSIYTTTAGGGTTTDADIVESPTDTFTVQITPDAEGLVVVYVLQVGALPLRPYHTTMGFGFLRRGWRAAERGHHAGPRGWARPPC